MCATVFEDDTDREGMTGHSQWRLSHDTYPLETETELLELHWLMAPSMTLRIDEASWKDKKRGKKCAEITRMH